MTTPIWIKRRRLLTLFSVAGLLLGLAAARIVRLSRRPSEPGATAAFEPSSPLPPAAASFTTYGTSPIEADIHWTSYYVAPVTRAEPGQGHTGFFIDREGVKHRVTVTEASHRRAQMESVVVGTDKQGRSRYAYQAEPGVWRELPEGVAAMGNKVNALTPLLYVAADQRLYPYGSLIYLPAAVGVRVSGHPPLDGYFWVGDSGGAIRGNHFDLFVGDEALYNNLLLRNVAPHYKTTIYPLPKLPKAQDPRNDAGMAAILSRLRFLDAAAPPTPETLKAAVLAYQKSNPHIPPAEYGDPDAAATLWFLTQEALKEGKGAASP